MQYEFEGDRPFLIQIYAFIMIIGLAFATWGFANVFSMLKFANKAIHTKARVVAFEKDEQGMTAVLRFESLQGDTIRFQKRVEPPFDKLGNEVEIIYENWTPRNYYLSSDNLYGGAFILFSIATPFLVISIGYFCFLRFLKKL